MAIAACGGSDDSKNDAPNDDGGKDSGTEPCEIEAPRECKDPDVTYADVAPIFEQHCTSCHAGVAGGPWPLLDYQHVSDWRDDIRADMLDCSMPPKDQVTEPMPAEDRLAILNWIRCGLPK